MNNETDSDSTESESEFFVSPSQVNVDFTFLENKEKQSNTTLRKNGTYESSDDSDEFCNVNDRNSVELFSQVLKNLENTQTICTSNETPEKQETAIVASTKQQKANSSEYFELLLEGEGNKFGLSDTSKSDNEDENLDDAVGPANYTTPKEGVKITLPGIGLLSKKKKNSRDINTIVVNQIKQRLRASQILIHKVGILCWLAHGFHLNKVINDTDIMSSLLSLMSAENWPKNRSDLTYLEKFIKWFRKKFTIKNNEEEENITKEVLLSRLQQKQVLNYKELVFLCVAMLRAIGMNCRLIVSLCPPPLKLQLSQLFKASQKEEKGKGKNVSDKPTKKKEKKKKREIPTQDKVIPENSEISRKNAQLIARKEAALILNAKSTRNKNLKSTTCKITHNETITKSNKNQCKISNNQEKAKKSMDMNETICKNTSRHLRTKNQMKNTSNDSSLIAVSKKEGKDSIHSLRRKQKETNVKTDILKEVDDDSEIDESEEELPAKKKRNISENKKTLKSTDKVEKSNKLLSSDDETNDVHSNKKSENFWLEVYLESEENWISVNIMDGKVHCATELYGKAGSPVLYIIAWNVDGTLKDVTRRYCAHWLTVTRKKRIDEEWFKYTLRPWKEKDTPLSQSEDKLLAQRELEQPLPKTIGECKGHPLYVLARHLLKYEALYPPDCVPLGYLQNGEAIYSRHCVHVLSSRETWIKKARVVKPNQEPYKIVKALPKYDKLSGAKVGDRTVELFGEWQTTEYVPPIAKDGIVPRNEYGNVDLFKQTMLPKGTVHIDLPGLNRIARKLNIDCAPAVVGFKFGCMGAVPAFEGFVVCAEYEDTLREAWEAEQVEAIKRAREKRYKRIYGNWRKLIDGLRIKEKLAKKYEFETKEESIITNKRTKQKISHAKRSKII
ncbi:hypothetical protein KPH14_003594 [Odynerus spinipes]|uniref:DNA repair protein Rad4 n=1 Tax=Odynerus spinipes TaxID=1348599 RepID=A0AAD9RD20_9HYME|nr:hypothetical protein KPH14_003594 [Odynerus spinipes]